jgi:regulator of protease activity HflC (stomatin/prohibitin superfamily)
MFTLGVGLIVIGLMLAIVLQGLRRIPADPPEVALVTFLGKRTRKVKREGWRFFFAYPYIFGYIPIGITNIPQDFTPSEVRTPDNAELKVPVSITWRPNGDKPEALITFIDNGMESGVKAILQNIVSERIRQWHRSPKEGPQTWEEAMGATDKTVEAILGTILARDVTQEEMKECRRGNGQFELPSLGIIISRLNIEQIEVIGTVKEAAEKAAKEEQEKKAESIEIKTFLELVKENEKAGFSKSEARDNVQVERGKVPKTINEHRISFDPAAIEAIKELANPSALTAIAEKLLAKKGDKQT